MNICRSMSDHTKTELVAQIREYQQSKLIRNYSRMRKYELREAINLPYAQIAEKTVRELRILCRDNNLKYRGLASSDKNKKELLECINSRQIQMTLPEKIVGNKTMIGIIAQNLATQYHISIELAEEYYILNLRWQHNNITDEQRVRKAKIEKIMGI